MPTVLVTGASRGLGLELARQYAADGWRVFACARAPARAADLEALAATSDGRVTAHRLDVAASAQRKLVTLTSVMGSVTHNTFGGLYAYRSSKAAANMVMKSLALDLKRRGIIAVPLHPGWVRTEIGGSRAELDVATSVTGLREVIAELAPAQAGHFLQWDGRELPW
jgi:NAD(P)-dependent dehydrogenase (short-subunit alcohol dehydrogenase family)